jgi:hypothetical protein
MPLNHTFFGTNEMWTRNTLFCFLSDENLTYFSEEIKYVHRAEVSLCEAK